ncbi:S16 family serine protease [Cellulomonas phragmiteti]|uniref:Lon proteolytic domain-containing protein n=1 Tax=Cellulomonas phragmiteti TaxID=478780 RepID=A0ABQ4DNY7_9CELL|nr:S16 family serine protease [Cellulomonas phragmiteti]GIG41070.1 hypothetical protein Cph01nite_28320 [Cellulomonas phragmiteti]
MGPIRRLAAGAVVVALLAAGCTAAADEPEQTATPAPSPTADAGPGSLTIRWLAYSPGGEGSVGETELTRTPLDDGDFRVEFSENEVGGIGPSAQAGAWNAAIVSTLLLGMPLSGEFRFATSGKVDGPSAGALTTAGLIALQRGDEILDDVTMTGTINPTGTIGPVGGIPEKVRAAAAEGFTRVLVPLGQRNSPDQAGEVVDVVRLGESEGVDVIEVGDVYEAYGHLTGSPLGAPQLGADPRLSNVSYDKVAAQVTTTLARYDTAFRRFEALPGPVRNMLVGTGLLDVATSAAVEARDLAQQGQQAGAFLSAQEAAMMAETLVGAGEWLNPLYTQGLPGLTLLFQAALDVSPTTARVTGFLDQLSTYSPRSVTDVEGLVNAYSGAFDAYVLLVFAHERIAAVAAQNEAGGYLDFETLFTDLAQPLLYARLAETMVTSTQATFELGRDNPGVPVDEDVDLESVGDFFRRGADANHTAFREIFVVPLAQQYGTTEEDVLARLAGNDMAVAFATVERNLLPVIEQYIGEGKPNAHYAALAYGVTNYVRNAGLIDKYYNNAELGPDLTIVGVRWQAALNRALDLGRQQLGSEITALRDDDIDPVLSVGSYEAAGVMRNGTDADRFGAVRQYSTGFVTARVVSYLAGRDVAADVTG